MANDIHVESTECTRPANVHKRDLKESGVLQVQVHDIAVIRGKKIQKQSVKHGFLFIRFKPFIWDESLGTEAPVRSTECREQAEEHLLQSAHLSITFFFITHLSILLCQHGVSALSSSDIVN